MRDWNHDGRVLNADDARQLIASYTAAFSPTRARWTIEHAAMTNPWTEVRAVLNEWLAAKPQLYIYRSPSRPLHMTREMAGTWSYDGSDIGPWTPATRYAFTTPIEDFVIRQFSLEVVVPTAQPA